MCSSGDPKLNKKSDEDEEDYSEMEEIIVNDDYDGDEEDIADGMEDLDFNSMEQGDDELIEKDDSKCMFNQHKGSVFVINVDPKYGTMAVSGGEDDKAFVWNIENGEIIFECEGHKDSVTCASFNYNSTLVATADMAGTIKVWDVATKKSIWDFETGDLEWLIWHSSANVLLAGTQDGQCWMWKVPNGATKVVPSPGSSSMCGILLPDGKSLAVGYGDGTIKIIDLKTTDALFTVKGRDAHKGEITQVNSHCTNNLIATGSLDGTAKLLNPQTGKVLSTFCCEQKSVTKDEEGDENSIESVGLSPSYPLFAMGSIRGDLDIWDIKNTALRHHCNHPAGVTQLLWDNASNGGAWIYTSCLDNVARIWDSRTGELIKSFYGHNDHIYSIAVTKDSHKLLSASADGTVRVFQIPEFESVNR